MPLRSVTGEMSQVTTPLGGTPRRTVPVSAFSYFGSALKKPWGLPRVKPWAQLKLPLALEAVREAHIHFDLPRVVLGHAVRRPGQRQVSELRIPITGRAQ